MPASVQIRQLTGASPGTAGAVDKTSGTVRFDLADTTDETSLANPIPVPGSGQNYSMRRVLRGYIASGTFSQISGLEMYSDGANGFGTGRKMWVAVEGQSAYVDPAIPSTANDPPQFPGATPMVDWFGFVTGAPYNLEVGNAGPFDSTGLPKYMGDFMNMVFEVEPTSVQGVTPSETLTVRWQEI